MAEASPEHGGASGNPGVIKKTRGRPSKCPTPYTIEPGTGCWTWQRAKNHRGYGLLWNGEKMVAAHRHYYETLRGPIPDGMQLDHLCRNRACVNPAHLEIVTGTENTRRGNVTKMTPERVRDVHRMRGEGMSLREIGKAVGVSDVQAGRIVSGKRWADEKPTEALPASRSRPSRVNNLTPASGIAPGLTPAAGMRGAR